MGNKALTIVALGAVLAALAHLPALSADTAVSVWRGETAYVKLGGESGGLRGASGEANGVTVASGYFAEVAYDVQPVLAKGQKMPDVFEKASRPDIWKEDGAKAPTAARITVRPDAKPGKYDFGSLEVTVVDRVLPPAKEWKYFLDLWQHPWAVSRYFNVKPFSKEHYAKMEPVWRALADCGCKALTVTLLDLPWNNQCYDAYHSMIGRVKRADGSWTFDYSIFDEYVEFGRKCGLGPDIACYTMCPWGYKATWTDADGRERREKLLPGAPEFEDYWAPFLVDFAAHLKAKGWFADAYIAMDERKPDDVRKIAEIIQRHAPGMKIAMCGNKSPSEFDGITIDNYCQGLIHLKKHLKFLSELEPRRARGCKTTFYVCCTAAHPNTFMSSPDDEGFWLGAYPVMAGFDGFLRWAANSWPEDPCKDASFKTKNWKAGDTFLIYPNGEMSARLIALRAGIVAAEKMRIMREAGEMTNSDIKRLAEPYGYKGAVANAFDFSAFRRDVEEFVNRSR